MTVALITTNPYAVIATFPGVPNPLPCPADHDNQLGMIAMLTKTDDVTSLTRDGYLHQRGLFDLHDLSYVEDVIECLFQQQAAKLRIDGDLETILEMLEHSDPAALYEVQKLIAASFQVRQLFDWTFVELCASQLDRDPKNLLIHGPGLFVSRPNTQRLLYKWHSEAHYYPKRRCFLNVWFPLFGNRMVENGAMEIMPGSHKRDFPFCEYQGFNAGGQKHHFKQLEIPPQFLTDYSPLACVADRGDAIIFDRSLVHRSCENRSKTFAFAMAVRVWDASDDLTLSGDMAATPYGGDYGYPNINVRADID